MSDLQRPEHPTLTQALPYWLKLGFISFGGPAGQIAMMHQEQVEKRRWISEHRFLYALNFCMLLPGPEAIQLAIYIAWLMHGVVGAIVAGVLFFLPSFLFILAGGPVIESTRGELKFTAPLTAITAAVVGVIVNLAVFFAWHTFWPQATEAAPFAGPFAWLQVVVACIAFVALWKYKADIIKVIGACAFIGLAYTLIF